MAVLIPRDKENHPTLASDLMEEWRAVIVDATAMSMINGSEIGKEDFIKNVDEPGCFLTKSSIKKYVSKLEKKLKTEVRYLDYVTYAVSFRRAILLQAEQLAKHMQGYGFRVQKSAFEATISRKKGQTEDNNLDDIIVI